ncbi:MAG TPA: hypothetical protein VFM57_14785 [Thermoleophilaceae bacterium]|nr:hypothetical protein [Thermoleophilaceae bacterium]
MAVIWLAVSAGGAAAAPNNDDFGDAIALRVGTTVKGSINGATKQPGEPRHARSLATRSVWYKFTSRRKRAIELGACNTNFDSVVAVYTGRSLRSLRPVDFNNDGCGESGGGSRVSFSARAGRVYRIAVAGFSSRGRFSLRTKGISVPPNDDFVDAVPIRLGETINGSTRGATRELDEPRHAGDEANLSVWFRLGVASQTVVQLDTCRLYSFDTVLAVYTGSRVSGLRLVTSDDDTCGLGSRVEFTAEPGINYRIAVAEYGGNRSGSFGLSARSLGAP